MCNRLKKYKLGLCLFFAIQILLLSACAPNDKVKAREQAWKQKLEQFNPIGKKATELLEWQNKNNIPLNSYPDKHGTILETLDGDGFICTRWNIYLKTEINSNKIVTAYSVKSVGRCL